MDFEGSSMRLVHERGDLYQSKKLVSLAVGSEHAIDVLTTKFWRWPASSPELEPQSWSSKSLPKRHLPWPLQQYLRGLRSLLWIRWLWGLLPGEVLLCLWALHMGVGLSLSAVRQGLDSRLLANKILTITKKG